MQKFIAKFEPLIQGVLSGPTAWCSAVVFARFNTPSGRNTRGGWGQRAGKDRQRNLGSPGVGCGRCARAAEGIHNRRRSTTGCPASGTRCPVSSRSRMANFESSTYCGLTTTPGPVMQPGANLRNYTGARGCSCRGIEIILDRGRAASRWSAFLRPVCGRRLSQRVEMGPASPWQFQTSYEFLQPVEPLEHGEEIAGINIHPRIPTRIFEIGWIP
jgi:hypothetical protein